MKEWTTEIVFLVALSSAACSAPGDHPDPQITLNQTPTVVVGTVGSAKIGAGEARAFAARTGGEPEAVARALGERQLLVAAAEVSPAELEYVRKQAMVRAYLEDEVESSVQLTQDEEARATSNLRPARKRLMGPCGYEMYLLKVVPEQVGEPARDAVREAAARAFARSTAYVGASSGGVQRLQSIDSFDLDGTFELSLEPKVKVGDPRCRRGEASDGWIRHNGLASGAVRLGLNTPFAVGFRDGDYVGFATRRIPGNNPTNEQVVAESKARFLENKRKAALQSLVEELREQGDVALFPERLDGRTIESP